MRKHSLFAALALLIVALWSGCKSDIDLQNLDTRSELEMGLALPLGTLRATVGDFLGNGQVKGIYVGDNRVMYFKDTFDISRTFHDVDLKDKVSDVDKEFDVWSELDRQGKLDDDGTINQTGKEIKMEFPFVLHLKNINNDVYEERLDSGQIQNATFTSIVDVSSLPLPSSWVTKVELELGDEFTRKQGHKILVSEQGKFHYNEKIPITVDEFTLNLMKRTGKNMSWQTYFNNNVKDECNLQINFYIKVPRGETVVIPKNAKYKYHLQVKFIDFHAIWGFFRPSSDMRDADTVNIEDEWPKWHDLSKATLPFYEPKVNMYIKSKIAGAMVMHGEYLYVKSSKTNDSIYATFDDNGRIWRNEYFNTEGGYLGLNSKIGDSIRYLVEFDNTQRFGHIDKLFAIRPDILGYKFYIDFDSVVTPQVRILPNTDMDIEAEVYAPFSFNKGLNASYKDTLENINLSSISLDSIAMNSSLIDTIKDAKIKLVIAFENRLPVRVRAHVRFMDENGNTVMDPDDPKQPLRLSQTDTLLVDAPKVVFEQGNSYIGDAGKSIFTLDIDKKHYDTFTSIKSMEYYAELDAEQMDPAYDENPKFHVQITADDNLRATLGLAAQGDVVLNFNGKEGE